MKPIMMNKNKQLGQGMTEYIVIVALVAIAAIAVYQFFGQTVRSQTAGMAQELAGEPAKTDIDAAKTAADGARSENVKKGLKSYTNDNSR